MSHGKFAKKCLMVEKFKKKMFPLNKSSHDMRKRDQEKFIVNKSLTERYRLSAIPYMQRLSNESDRKKQKRGTFKLIFPSNLLKMSKAITQPFLRLQTPSFGRCVL